MHFYALLRSFRQPKIAVTVKNVNWLQCGSKIRSSSVGAPFLFCHACPCAVILLAVGPEGVLLLITARLLQYASLSRAPGGHQAMGNALFHSVVMSAPMSPPPHLLHCMCIHTYIQAYTYILGYRCIGYRCCFLLVMAYWKLTN